MQAHAFYGLALIFMCSLLTYGLLRMKWETIQDLKDGLEEKVELRTKELEEALSERNQTFAHLNQELAEAALKIIRKAKYANAATVEFLLDKDQKFYFIAAPA